MKIGIAGYFGYGNLGDEWYVATWRSLFGHGNVRTLTVPDRRSIEGLDGIIIGGGDLIHPGMVNNNYFNYDMLSVPVYIYGVGVPLSKFKWDKKVVDFYRDFFGRASVVMVRDEESYMELKRAGIRVDGVVEDVAFGGPLPHGLEFPPDGNSNWLGVEVRSTLMPSNYIREVMDAVARTAVAMNREHDMSSYIITMASAGLKKKCDVLYDCYDGSDVLNSRLSLEIGEQNVKRSPVVMDVMEILPEINPMKMLITSKFHGMIAGLRYRVPTIGVSPGGSRKFVALSRKVDPMTLCTELGDLPEAALRYFGEVKSGSDIMERFDYLISRIESRCSKELQHFKDDVLSGG